VTEATAPPSKKLSLSRRIRDTAAAYPAAVAIGIYALVAIAATVAAYLAIFTIFAPYDDEGTLLVTLKAFVNGETLYRDIWSVYGPFYYELFGGFFSLSGLDVTNDVSRSIVIVVWVGTSLMFGLAAQRLTGRLALGVAGMVATFSVLAVLANEPMHPQGLCVLLLSAFALLAVSGPMRRIAWAGAGCGALLAALVLTKANVGVFAVAAVVLAAVLTVEPLSRRSWLRWLVIAAFLAMPVAILNRDLNQVWVRELLLLEVLASSAVIVAAWPLRSRSGEGDTGLTRWVIAAAAAFVAAFLAIIAIVVLTGPSLADVYDGVVTQAFGIRDILVIPLSFPAGAVVDWAVAALAAATLASRVLPTNAEKPSLWPGLVRAAVGLTILFTVAHIVPFGLNPSSANPDTLPLVLAWVAAIAPIGLRESAYKRFLRVLLPALAVAETLQVYPVAGSQMGIAAVTFVPVAALCLADALVELRAWSSTRGTAALERFGEVAGVATVAVAGMFALGAIVLPAASNLVIYRNQPKLALPGASLLHLPAPTVATYVGLVNLLHQHHCSTFIGYPSVNSLYLWSGLPSPPPQVPNAWMFSLDESQQQKAVDHLRASRRPCAIRSHELATSYVQGAPPDTPLVRYVFNEFKPAAKVGSFEFLLPTRSATTP
jgi:hypothetical protein